MNKISVALPAYNSSVFIEDLILNFINAKSIKEIVINDDNSPSDEFEKLLSIVEKFKTLDHIDIVLDRNKENHGEFINTYLTVEKCQSDFIYQIDQDNLPSLKSLKKLSKMNNLGEYKDCLFLPSSLYPFRFDHKKESRFSKNKITFFNKNTILNKNQVGKMIKEKVPLHSNKFTIEFSLGAGNVFFHKNTYLKKIKEGLKEDRRNISSSSHAVSYYWLKNNGRIFYPKHLYHFHRRHANSQYNLMSEDVDISAEFIRNKIIEWTIND